jgi:hypothetical protein
MICTRYEATMWGPMWFAWDDEFDGDEDQPMGRGETEAAAKAHLRGWIALMPSGAQRSAKGASHD